MKYSQMSKYAQADLQRVMTYLVSGGYEVGKLPQAIQANSPIIEKHIVMALKNGEYADATPNLKRMVGMLMVYADKLAQGEADGYPRANQAEAVGEANRKAGRVSISSRVNLPEHLEDWWAGMSAEERGDFIAGAYLPEAWEK